MTTPPVPTLRPARAVVSLLVLALLGSPAFGGEKAALRAGERPDAAALEREGTVIGTVRIRVIDVFDTSIPEENRWAYRLVNALHVTTREATVRRQLLFREGERLRVSRLQETERNLRALPFVQDAAVVVVSASDGLATVLVTIQDDWTTRAGIRFGSAGNKTTSAIGLSEINLLGRGKSLDVIVDNGLDRTQTKFIYDDPNLLGSRHTLRAFHQNSTDGTGNGLRLELPFYSLESRRAWGIEGSEDRSRFSSYRGGEIVRRFDKEEKDAGLWCGWSAGLVGGTTVRWSVGGRYAATTYTPTTRLPVDLPPEEIPEGRTTVGPFVAYEWIRPDFIKVKNFTRFSRWEDYNLGGHLSLSLQLSLRGLGADDDEVLYDFEGSKGARTGPEAYLLANGFVRGRAGARQQAAVHIDAIHYYVGWPHQTFVVGFAADRGIHLDASRRFLLGGESGLRGFEARRFDGDRRLLLNVEDRYRWERQILRLLQPGVAVFVDVGNAWGGVGREGFGNLKADVGVSFLADIVRASHAGFLRFNLAWPVEGGKYGQPTVLFSFGKSSSF